jgi:hypothetical protein
VSLRDSMRASVTPYLRSGETVQAVIGGQTKSQWLMPLTGFIGFMFINRYRIVVVTQERVLVLDAGRASMKKAQGLVAELPRSTRLGPGSGAWHPITLGQETIRVHRRFFKDLETADRQAAVA